jgi:hypothetical protein
MHVVNITNCLVQLIYANKIFKKVCAEFSNTEGLDTTRAIVRKAGGRTASRRGRDRWSRSDHFLTSGTQWVMWVQNVGCLVLTTHCGAPGWARQASWKRGAVWMQAGI